MTAAAAMAGVTGVWGALYLVTGADWTAGPLAVAWLVPLWSMRSLLSAWLSRQMMLATPEDEIVCSTGLYRSVRSALLAVAPLVAALVLETRGYDVLMGAHVVLHAFLSMLAYSVITIATLIALLLGIQNRQLHEHQLDGRLNRFLPPLQTMERLLFEWLMIGFVLLTAAMISGGLFVDNLLTQDLVHKTVLTFVAWLFFAVLLFGHFHLGWRGALASRLTVFGFIFLMLAFFGSKFVLEYLLHRYG